MAFASVCRTASWSVDIPLRTSFTRVSDNPRHATVPAAGGAEGSRRADRDEADETAAECGGMGCLAASE